MKKKNYLEVDYDTRQEKTQKTNEASRVLMCRIAALLPEEKHGCFSGDPSISTYQIENDSDPV